MWELLACRWYFKPRDWVKPSGSRWRKEELQGLILGSSNTQSLRRRNWARWLVRQEESQVCVLSWKPSKESVVSVCTVVWGHNHDCETVSVISGKVHHKHCCIIMKNSDGYKYIGKWKSSNTKFYLVHCNLKHGQPGKWKCFISL